MNQLERVATLKSLLRDQGKILVLDGAMGTSIQNYNLGPEDFGGPEYEGCNEYLTLTRPSPRVPGCSPSSRPTRWPPPSVRSGSLWKKLT